MSCVILNDFEIYFSKGILALHRNKIYSAKRNLRQAADIALIAAQNSSGIQKVKFIKLSNTINSLQNSI